MIENNMDNNDINDNKMNKTHNDSNDNNIKNNNINKNNSKIENNDTKDNKKLLKVIEENKTNQNIVNEKQYSSISNLAPKLNTGVISLTGDTDTSNQKALETKTNHVDDIRADNNNNNNNHKTTVNKNDHAPIPTTKNEDIKSNDNIKGQESQKTENENNKVISAAASVSNSKNKVKKAKSNKKRQLPSMRAFYDGHYKREQKRKFGAHNCYDTVHIRNLCKIDNKVTLDNTDSESRATLGYAVELFLSDMIFRGCKDVIQSDARYLKYKHLLAGYKHAPYADLLTDVLLDKNDL